MHFKLLLSLFFAISSLLSFGQVVSIGSASNSVEGSGTPLSFQVSLENGVINTTGSDITGTFSLTGSATSGVDYIGPMNFAIPNGLNSIGVLVPVIDDAQCEGDEIAVFTITSVSTGVISPTSNSANATILDDDCSTFLISIGSPVDGVEGSSDITFDIFIEGGLVNTTGAPITGNINYSGSAMPGTDFSGPSVFSIPNGANSTTITVTIIDNFLIEPTETVVATLTGSPSAGTYANTTSTANIIDDDAVNMTISIDSVADGEEAGNDVVFVVSLDNGVVNNTGADIHGVVSYAGTSTILDDYTGALTTFSIPNGETSDTIVLTVIDDACVEYSETVEATISAPNVGSINNATATANIVDNDLSNTTISIGMPSDGEEGGTDVSFIISIDGGLINCLGAPISGSITFSGTATTGVDYSSVGSFSIPDGNAFVILTLPVIDDIDDECDETVVATISNLSIGTLNIDTSTAIIIDNDCTLGLTDQNNFGLTIYPNPVRDRLNFEAEQQMSAYSIIDISGRLIESGRVAAKEFEVPTDGLLIGTYFIEIEFENGTVIKKKMLKE